MGSPRMTTRRWMVLIATVAIDFGAEMMRRRLVAYRNKANLFASYEAEARG